MSVKILGALLLMLCGGAVGVGKKMAMRRRIAFLAAFESALSLMEAEIELCCRPLPEIFELLSYRGAEETSALFAALAKKCEIMSAAQAWDECCCELELPDEARRAICSAAAVLGAYDSERQSAELRSLRKSLSALREALVTTLQRKGASYPALGACIAGIFAMLMI